MLTTIDPISLSSVTGGAQAAGPSAEQQAQFRKLAQSYCPQTAAKNAGARTLTRKMGEACLDEAHLGMFKGQLDQYFPRR